MNPPVASPPKADVGQTGRRVRPRAGSRHTANFVDWLAAIAPIETSSAGQAKIECETMTMITRAFGAAGFVLLALSAQADAMPAQTGRAHFLLGG